LHLLPQPAHPSYRLITALRLYHLFSASADEVPPDAEGTIRRWNQVLLGNEDFVSEENESAWKGTLLRICEGLVGHATSAITNDRSVEDQSNPEWAGGVMRRAIRILWEEEIQVAEEVSKSILKGVQF
jgi:hypothetical protein